jgi:hypothetical protein
MSEFRRLVNYKGSSTVSTAQGINNWAGTEVVEPASTLLLGDINGTCTSVPYKDGVGLLKLEAASNYVSGTADDGNVIQFGNGTADWWNNLSTFEIDSTQLSTSPLGYDNYVMFSLPLSYKDNNTLGLVCDADGTEPTSGTTGTNYNAFIGACNPASIAVDVEGHAGLAKGLHYRSISDGSGGFKPGAKFSLTYFQNGDDMDLSVNSSGIVPAHTHDMSQIEFDSGATSKVKNGYFQKTPSHHTASSVTFGKFQYVQTFTADNGDIWNIYDINRYDDGIAGGGTPGGGSSASYGDYKTIIASSPAAAIHTANLANTPNYSAINSTLLAADAAGVSYGSTNSGGLSANNSTEEYSPVMFSPSPTSLPLSSLGNLPTSTRPTVKVYNSDGVAVSGTTDTLTDGEQDECVKIIGQWFCWNMTKAEANAGLGNYQTESQANHRDTDVFVLDNLALLKWYPIASDIEAENIVCWQANNPSTPADSSSITDQLKVFDITGTITGNGGINSTNQQSLKVNFEDEGFLFEIHDGGASNVEVDGQNVNYIRFGYNPSLNNIDSIDQELSWNDWMYTYGAEVENHGGNDTGIGSMTMYKFPPKDFSEGGAFHIAMLDIYNEDAGDNDEVAAWFALTEAEKIAQGEDLEGILDDFFNNTYNSTTQLGSEINHEYSDWCYGFSSVGNTIVVIPGDYFAAPGTVPSDGIPGTVGVHDRIYMMEQHPDY